MLRARNPQHSVRIGGDHMVFAGCGGMPFYRDGQTRREGTLNDLHTLLSLVQQFAELDLAALPAVEPNDTPLDSRHLDLLTGAIRYTDKALYLGSLSGVNIEDAIAMAGIVFGDGPLYASAGGRLPSDPAHSPDVPFTSLLVNINVNSPLRYDGRMLEGLFAAARAGQASVITPFLLMGAMAPVTMAAALAQQTAEALVGVALTQLLRPGSPVVLGSFLSTIDMQSGSPAFGGPESVKGLVASGQLARRYGTRFRTCFYRPLLSSTENYERWVARGSRDAAARAGELWRAALGGYEQPAFDPAVDAALTAYVIRRRTELGD